jgi:hypothetical protein
VQRDHYVVEDAFEKCHCERTQEILLTRKVVEERRFGDVGGATDIDDGGCAAPALFEQRGRRFEDTVASGTQIGLSPSRQ